MAIRGKVKNIRDMGGSGYTGIVKDTANNIEYNFEQPMGKELGLVENMVVRMEVITKSDGTKLAICLDPVDKARIETIDLTTNTGTLKNNLGNIINFSQNYCTELGLQVGDKVSYTVVPEGGTISDGGLSDGSTGTSGGLGGGSTGITNTLAGTAVCLQKVG